MEGVKEEEATHLERIQHFEVRAQIESDLARIATESHFNSLEKIKGNFELVDVDFEKTPGVLTPTMKIKRKNAREYFGEQIKAIYKRIDEKLSKIQ